MTKHHKGLGTKMKSKEKLGRNYGVVVFSTFLLSVLITLEAFCDQDDSATKTITSSVESLPQRGCGESVMGVSDVNLAAEQKCKPLLSEIDKLKKDFNHTSEQMDKMLTYYVQCNEKAIDSVNTSISGASFALTIVGILVAVGGLGLGIYISFLEKKVRNLTIENRTILETHLKIKNEVEILDRNIKTNMGKLYDDLKKEETKTLVMRLVKVPQDIANLGNTLASRDITTELFPEMKKALQLLPKDSPEYGYYAMAYRVLFFQHFPALALFDKDIASEIEQDYHDLMNASFENDIIKTSTEFLKRCVDIGLLDCRDKIRKYFAALSKSKHAGYFELHREIYKTLCTKENRFNLYSVLDSEDLKDIRKIYEQFMLSDYRDDPGNTESQKLVLKRIAEETGEKRISDNENSG